MKRVILIIVCLTLAAGCSDSTTVSPSEAKRAFVWFGKLGFPDVKGVKYVRVATGQWSQHGSAPRQNTYLNAFLLSEKGVMFTVLTQDLFIRTFEKTEPNAPKHLQIAYEELNLENEAKTYLNLLQNPPEDDDSRRFGELLNERAEVFVLAWACYRNELESIPQELCNQVISMREFGEKGGLIDLLQKDLGHAMMWRAVLAFEDPAVSRKEILAKFEYIVKYYPKSEHIKRARNAVKILRRMIKEDQAHGKRAKQPEKMSTDEQIADLIFRLRDQNARQLSQPGRCDIYDDPQGEQSPAHRLVQLGHKAVPKLIEALEDKSFTRSVGYWRGYCFSHYVLRVGDCALEILESIAARQFYSGSHIDYMSKDDETASTRKQVEAWWAELQEKGEKRLWIDGAEKGDETSPWQAKRLLERYPDVALEPIIKGAKSAKERWPRVNMVKIATQVEGDGPIAFLTEEMANGPFLGSRIEAAWGLHRKGRPEAVTAMIRVWKQSESPGDMGVAKFLIVCESVEALQAIREGLSAQDAFFRIRVIWAVQREIRRIKEAIEETSENAPNESLKANAPALFEAMEELLVSRLTDTEEKEGLSASYGDPRVCDMAGYALWLNWKDKYAFDLNATLKQRNLHRIQCANVWRKQHYLPLLPLPRTRVIVPLPKEKIGPLLNNILNAKTKAEIETGVANVESLGLPSLTPVHNLLSDLPNEHPIRAEVVALAKRLSCIVEEITFAEGSAKPDAKFTRILEDIKGESLTSEKFIRILLHVARDTPKGATGIRIKAVRHEDLTGVDLNVRLPTHKVPSLGEPPGWHNNEMVIVGKESILGSYGTSSLGYLRKLDAYDDLKKAIDKAVSSPPNLPFIIRATLIQEDSSTQAEKSLH